MNSTVEKFWRAEQHIGRGLVDRLPLVSNYGF